MEVQKADDDNHVRRVRYNTSCVTANIMEHGTKFEKVPNVIGIYISKFDMFKSGKTLYHIDCVIRETGEVQDNGLQEIYVNTKIDDGTNIAELMRIFKEKDTALKLFQNGADYELVRVSITSLSDEELQKIYQEAISG